MKNYGSIIHLNNFGMIGSKASSTKIVTTLKSKYRLYQPETRLDLV